MTGEPRAVPKPDRASSLRWWRMTQKELREILRDRRTIFTLIGMPLLIYPLLGVTFQKLLVSQAIAHSKIEYRVAFADQEASRVLREIFRQSEAVRPHVTGESPPAKPAGTTEDPIWEFLVFPDPSATVDVSQLVADRTADIGVRLVEGSPDGPWNFELSYRSSSAFSLNARRAVEDRMRFVNDRLIQSWLHQSDPPLKLPIEFSQHVVASTDGGTSFSMASLIPLILILMTVTGAVYPAIDLTAGERERGTLEALISAPVPRHELLFAKFLAVLSVAILTALANMTSMVVTAYSGGMEQLLFGSAGISVKLLVEILGLLIVFGGFFASVILILTSFARSFKEAQAYLIPLMLVSLAPGVLCLMPDIEMTSWMSVTPLVNIVILARDLFDGRAQTVWVLSVLLSTVLYSAVALSAAARIFGTDAVLYGSEGSWSDLLRRPSQRLTAPTLTQAMLCVAVLFPAYLILSGLPARISGGSPLWHLAANAGLTIIVFALIPLLLASWTSVRLISGFRLGRASLASFFGAFLLGISLWPFAVEVFQLQTATFELTEQFRELFERVKVNLEAIPLPARLLALAVIPAVCEELFFRGYLLTGLRTGMSTPLAVALSSCLFGLFHVFPFLSFERFLPTCFLGLVLGTVCCLSGSLWPGILLHVTHNSLLLLMQAYEQKLMSWGIGSDEAQPVPMSWLAGAALIVAAGATLLWIGRDRQRFTSIRGT